MKTGNLIFDNVDRAQRRMVLSEKLPDLSNLPIELIDAIFSEALDENDEPHPIKRARYDAENALCLFKVIPRPRFCHLKYAERLTFAELHEEKKLREKLVEFIERNKSAATNRDFVFHHLWKEIVVHLSTEDSVRWAEAYTLLVPLVKLGSSILLGGN